MARRFSAPYQSEPVSSLATWARNLAVFSLVTVPVSILIVRFGFLEMKPALATFFGALGCAVLSILVSFGAFAAGIGLATPGDINFLGPEDVVRFHADTIGGLER